MTWHKGKTIDTYGTSGSIIKVNGQTIVADLMESVADKGLDPPSEKVNKLWERVPDEGHNRKMLQLWHEGYTAHEIGRMVGLTEQTVFNRLSKLRGIYGDDVVPRRRNQLKHKIE